MSQYLLAAERSLKAFSYDRAQVEALMAIAEALDALKPEPLKPIVVTVNGGRPLDQTIKASPHVAEDLNDWQAWKADGE